MRRSPLRLALLALLTLASTGCGLAGGASPTPTPSPTPTATPTSTPTATPTPQPQLETESIEIAQGGAAAVRVRGDASSAVAAFDGETYALAPINGGFWGLLGAAADKAAGSYPLSVLLYDAGGGVFTELTGAVTVLDSGYLVEEILLPPDRAGLLDPALAAQEAATRAEVFATFTPERRWSGTFIFPVDGPLSSPYGTGRSYNGGPVTSYHSGADFALDEGTPVVASNSGRVVFSGELPIRGVSVIIDHGAGVFSGYHHLQSAAAPLGEMVAKGDLVGSLGGTGLSTGPHLHWEIIVQGVTVDPVPWTEREFGP